MSTWGYARSSIHKKLISTIDEVVSTDEASNFVFICHKWILPPVVLTVYSINLVTKDRLKSHLNFSLQSIPSLVCWLHVCIFSSMTSHQRWFRSSWLICTCNTFAWSSHKVEHWKPTVLQHCSISRNQEHFHLDCTYIMCYIEPLIWDTKTSLMSSQVCAMFIGFDPKCKLVHARFVKCGTFLMPATSKPTMKGICGIFHVLPQAKPSWWILDIMKTRDSGHTWKWQEDVAK